MRKLLWAVLAAAVALTCAGIGYERYRILPLDNSRQNHHVSVLSAFAEECVESYKIAHQFSNGMMILQTKPNRGQLKINNEELRVENLPLVLDDILRTRIDRTVFLVDNSEFDRPESAVLEKLVEQIPEVDRVCVIDPRHAPEWYPPVWHRFLGASGGGIQIASRTSTNHQQR